MIKLKFIKTFFVLLVLFSGGLTAADQNKSAPDISGRITKLNRSDAEAQTVLGSILVKRDAGATGEYDKADVKITAQTRIYAEADQEKRASFLIAEKNEYRSALFLARLEEFKLIS